MVTTWISHLWDNKVYLDLVHLCIITLYFRRIKIVLIWNCQWQSLLVLGIPQARKRADISAVDIPKTQQLTPKQWINSTTGKRTICSFGVHCPLKQFFDTKKISLVIFFFYNSHCGSGVWLRRWMWALSERRLFIYVCLYLRCATFFCWSPK